jgi:signal transduction histidine kinase/DNA-binding response OmpR family regulator/Flp pilus assembly protein TadD
MLLLLFFYRFHVHCFLLLITFIAFLPDGLTAQSYQRSEDSLLVYDLGGRAFSLRAQQPDSALLLADEALQIATPAQDTQAQINLWRIKGVIRYGQKTFDAAYDDFLQSYTLARITHFREGRLLINLGNVSFKQKEYSAALKHFDQARILSEQKDTLVWMDALNNLASVYINTGNYPPAIPHLENALSLQRAIRNQQAQLPTLYNLAFARVKANEAAASLADFFSGIALAKELQEPAWVAKFETRLGYTYNYRTQYPQSIAAYQRALVIRDSLGNIKAKGNLLQSLGEVHQYTKDYDLALDYFQRALISQQSVNDYYGMAQSLNAIGENHKEQGAYKAAIAYFHQASALRKSRNPTSRNFYPLYNLGDSYEQLNQLDSARFYLQQALPQTVELARNYEESLVNTSLGKVYQKLGQTKQAINYFRRAIVSAQNENLRKEEMEASWGLYTVLKAGGNTAQALQYLERHHALRDTVFNEETTREITRLEANYGFTQEKNKLELENERQRASLDAKLRWQRTWQIILGGILLLSVIGFLLYARFLRIRRTAESKKEQIERARLEEMDAFKSRFFANISHELRTPLTLIIGPISRLLKQSELEGNERTQLQLIQDNAEQLKERVEEILDLTKLDAGRMLLRETATPLYDFLRRTVANFESYAQQKQQQLTIDYRLDKGLSILLDQGKFAHVINNLLSNAIKYTPEKGHISVALYEKEEGPQTIVLEVKDSGIGIRAEDLPNVFDRYYQVDAEENKAGGSGIGLTLTQEVAKLMKAELKVESQRQKGSTFFFEFSAREVMGVVQAVEQPQITQRNSFEQVSEPAGERPTILVVEDNKQLREYLQFILSDQFKVVTAENGAVALEKLSGLDCQLILSDVMMPRMDGFELLTELKKSDQYRQLPVIMLTARSEMDDKLKALRVGVDDYLLKPFVEEELLARIENLLGNYSNRQKLQAASKEGMVSETLTISNVDLKWLSELEELLKSEVANPDYNIEQLAAYFFISRSQLQRRLKKVTGLSPNKYFREIKLQVARELLDSGDFRTVNEVATAVGFTSAHYFSTIYDKRFGKMPSKLL